MSRPRGKVEPTLEQCLSQNHMWNDFGEYKKINSEFMVGIRLLESHQVRQARRFFLAMLPNCADPQRIHLYNFLALSHLYSLEFQECEYYLRKGQESSVGREYSHFLHCWFFIQRRAEIPGPTPLISIGFEDHCSLTCPALGDPLKSIFENKMLLDSLLENTPYSHIRHFRRFATEEQFTGYVGRIKEHYSGFSVLSIYMWTGELWIYDLSSIKRVGLDWRRVLGIFDDLMAQNRAVLSMKAATDQEKRMWWQQRIELDRKLGRLIKEVASAFANRSQDRMILILDGGTIRFPFERVFNKVAYRVRSLEALYLSGRSTPQRAKRACRVVRNSYYLLDADNNLPNTRQCMSNFFEASARSIRIMGATGRPLSREEQLQLAKHDLFMYFGHGSGRKHFQLDDLRPWIAFLFGCSSCRLVCAPNFTYNGTLLTHLGRGRAVLGMLWDVTDRDLDQFTISFLRDFWESGDLGAAMHKNIGRFRLKHLNGAAVVAYGCVDPITLSH